MRRRVSHPTSTTGVSPVVQDGIRDASVQAMLERSRGIPSALPSGHRQPVFGDFTAPEFTDYHLHLNAVREVDRAFQSLPSRVREEFHNDPAALGAALDNPVMQPRMAELGFKVAPPPPESLRPDPEANPHKADNNEA